MQFCAQVQVRGTWAIDRGTLPVGAGVALDWAALERVLAAKKLGAKFPFVEHHALLSCCLRNEALRQAATWPSPKSMGTPHFRLGAPIFLGS